MTKGIVISKAGNKKIREMLHKVGRISPVTILRRPPVVAGDTPGISYPDGRVELDPDADAYINPAIHLNKILYFCPSEGVDRSIYLPSTPAINATYRFIIRTDSQVFVKMTNDNHFIDGPVRLNDLDRCMAVYAPVIHAYWFNWRMGPLSVQFYQREFLVLPQGGDSGAMVHWLTLTYTGEQRQVDCDYVDTDDDGYYNRPEWGGPPYPEHPLLTKTISGWMITRSHGPCLPALDAQYSQVPF